MFYKKGINFFVDWNLWTITLCCRSGSIILKNTYFKIMNNIVTYPHSLYGKMLKCFSEIKQKYKILQNFDSVCGKLLLINLFILTILLF